MGGLEIDDQRVFGRLLNREVGRTGALEDTVDVRCCLRVTVGIVEVAFFAANAEGVPPLVAIKSTLRPTRSAANAGSRS